MGFGFPLLPHLSLQWLKSTQALASEALPYRRLLAPLACCASHLPVTVVTLISLSPNKIPSWPLPSSSQALLWVTEMNQLGAHSPMEGLNHWSIAVWHGRVISRRLWEYRGMGANSAYWVSQSGDNQKGFAKMLMLELDRLLLFFFLPLPRSFQNLSSLIRD